MVPLLLSIPVAVALTWGTAAVPARTFRDRLRRLSQELGTALCAAAAAASLGVVVRWSLRAWILPYADGSPWTYGARVLFEWGAWCGMVVLVALVLLTLEGRSRRPIGWLEWARLALATYWVAAFLIFSVL